MSNPMYHKYPMQVGVSAQLLVIVKWDRMPWAPQLATIVLWKRGNAYFIIGPEAMKMNTATIGSRRNTRLIKKTLACWTKGMLAWRCHDLAANNPDKTRKISTPNAEFPNNAPRMGWLWTASYNWIKLEFNYKIV